MEIVPPYGYAEIVPLRKSHRVLLPQGLTPSFCRSLNAMAVSLSEFTAAARDYPIVFATPDAGNTYAPVVMVGLKNDENLFIDQEGNWQAGVYIPAFVRRYPFCVARVFMEGKPAAERILCVAKEYLDEAGHTLYDSRGNPTTQWKSMERLLWDYDADLQRTARVCESLNRLGLFSPFDLESFPDFGSNAQISGMYRVDPVRLQALDPEELKNLLTAGVLDRVYAHLHSLENFSRLIGRVAKAQRPLTNSAPLRFY